MVALEKDIGPRELFYVRQIKHYLDIDKYPWWKRFIFYRIYRPFVLFIYHGLKMPVLMKLDAQGRPCWEERRGFCETEAEAKELVRGQPWMSYSPLYEGTCLPTETCVSGPNVDTGRNGQEIHVRKDWSTEALLKKPIEKRLETLSKHTKELREIL